MFLFLVIRFVPNKTSKHVDSSLNKPLWCFITFHQKSFPRCLKFTPIIYFQKCYSHYSLVKCFGHLIWQECLWWVPHARLEMLTPRAPYLIFFFLNYVHVLPRVCVPCLFPMDFKFCYFDTGLVCSSMSFYFISNATSPWLIVLRKTWHK